MASFESCLAKFARAEKQCEALSSDLLSLSDLKSYGITKDIENATGYQIYRFDSVPPIPEDLGLRIGEMLYNFRCSLDHIIWELVSSSGNIPTYRNEFPIFNDILKYNSEKRSKLKGIPNAHIPLIDSLQPCNPSGDIFFTQYLWYLHQLCNADKHRYLLLTRRAFRKNMRISFTTNRVPKMWFFNVPIENGAVFLRLEPNMDVDVNPTIDVLFSNAPSDIRTDLPVGSIIELIHGSVYNVLRKFHVL